MEYTRFYLFTLVLVACQFDASGYEGGGADTNDENTDADAGDTEEPQRNCGDGICEAVESCGICSDDCGGCTTGVVSPMSETVTVAQGDAHDVAVWIDQDDPTQSLIFGTDEDSSGGLHVYDLTGTERAVVDDGGALYNVDVRGDIVVAGNRSRDRLAVFRVDPSTRSLADTAAWPLMTGFGAYGICMYRSATSDGLYVFVTSSGGDVEQWHLYDTGGGQLGAALVRELQVGSKTEGCVADDDTGALYLAEEQVGIWRYGAEPTDGDARILVDAMDGVRLNDLEGLALYRASDGEAGYLIASSQDNDEFVVYRRDGANEYVTTFAVVEGGPFDGCEHTQGIEVVNRALGGALAHGMFLCADENNDGGTSNFKLVPWDGIAAATGGLMVE